MKTINQSKNIILSTSVAMAMGVVFLLSAVSAQAAHQNESGQFVYGAMLSGSSEVPAVTSDTSGQLSVLFSESKAVADFELAVEDGESITAAHLHCAVAGENGPVVAVLFGDIPGGFNVDGTLAAFTLTDANIVPDTDCPNPITDVASLALAMDAGEIYVNVHSVANPSGEVRGQLAPVPQTMPEVGNPDKDADGFISVAEGLPFYGGIAYSLTTTGLTGTESALALNRFPVADRNGRYTYERTFMLEEGADVDSFHVIVHGIDIDKNGAYDGEKESSIAPGVPFEATVPAACGVLEMRGNSDTYQAKIEELNSTGVNGKLTAKKDGNMITVEMKVRGVSPNLAHAQHFHVGGSGVCPPNTIGVGQY